MRIKVFYFGVLRERFKFSDEVIELSDGAALGDLLRVLRSRASNHAMGHKTDSSVDERLWRSLAVAVNREYSLPEAVLRDGDEVALLPPVSGGCCAHGGCFADGRRLDSLASSKGIVLYRASERTNCGRDGHAD